MPDDLYSPPTCPVYVDRLIADTMDLTDEEFGVYMRLILGRQWPKGSIPSDPADQARLTHNQTAAKMKKFASVIGQRLQPHPTAPNAVHSPFMERVREDMRKRNKTNSTNGKKGADKRWNRDSEAIATPSQNDGETDSQAIAKASQGSSQTDGFQSPIPISTPSASPRDAGARTRDAAKTSPAFAFCEWYLQQAIAAGAIGGHHAQDSFAWCYGQFEHIEPFVEHYGEAECRVRAERFIKRAVMPWLRQAKDIKALAKWWDSAELRGSAAESNNGVSEQTRSYLAEIAAEERRPGAA